MAPLSPGDTKRTSGCTPRAMRVHAGHTPHASTPEPGTLNPEPASCLTSRQLSACATASAARCLPTPAGPANNRLGGSVLPATERDSKSISRTWPTTSLKGMVGCYHALILRRPAFAEEARPEPALFRGRRLRGLRCLVERREWAAGIVDRGHEPLVLDAQRRRTVGAEPPGEFGDHPARRVLRAVRRRLRARREVLGVDHRPAFELAVAHDLDVLAAVGGAQTRQPADARGRHAIGRDEPLRCVVARRRLHEVRPRGDR